MNDEHDNRSPDSDPPGDFSDKRQEERHSVPAVYLRYITLEVKNGNDVVPVAMGNFSRHGILFLSPAAFPAGAHAQCIISVPQLLSRDISFGIHVKYCFNRENAFIVGAAIETVADQTWFDVFVEIHDFIVQRRDVVY